MLEEGWTLIQSTGEPVSQSVKMQTRGEKATGDGNRDQSDVSARQVTLSIGSCQEKRETRGGFSFGASSRNQLC